MIVMVEMWFEKIRRHWKRMCVFNYTNDYLLHCRCRCGFKLFLVIGKEELTDDLLELVYLTNARQCVSWQSKFQ